MPPCRRAGRRWWTRGRARAADRRGARAGRGRHRLPAPPGPRPATGAAGRRGDGARAAEGRQGAPRAAAGDRWRWRCRAHPPVPAGRVTLPWRVPSGKPATARLLFTMPRSGRVIESNSWNASAWHKAVRAAGLAPGRDKPASTCCATPTPRGCWPRAWTSAPWPSARPPRSRLHAGGLRHLMPGAATGSG